MAGSRNRDRALAWIIWNQLATPGLGTWLSGRRARGALQMALAFTGFFIVCAAFLTMLRTAWEAADGVSDLPPGLPWFWKPGFVLFGVAWLWAALSSVRLWREARWRDAAEPPQLC
ncbi:MAG: hypothetical protein ACKVYV_13700 [Limisphaerales bacterium]